MPLDRYSSQGKGSREHIEYVSYLLKSVNDDIFDDITEILESHFSQDRLDDIRLAASDMVRIRDDMNHRMELYRNGSRLTIVECDPTDALPHNEHDVCKL